MFVMFSPYLDSVKVRPLTVAHVRGRLRDDHGRLHRSFLESAVEQGWVSYKFHFMYRLPDGCPEREGLRELLRDRPTRKDPVDVAGLMAGYASEPGDPAGVFGVREGSEQVVPRPLYLLENRAVVGPARWRVVDARYHATILNRHPTAVPHLTPDPHAPVRYLAGGEMVGVISPIS